MAVYNLSGGAPKDANLRPTNLPNGGSIWKVTGTMPPTVTLTQAQYDALPEKDGDTLYLVTA